MCGVEVTTLPGLHGALGSKRFDSIFRAELGPDVAFKEPGGYVTWPSDLPPQPRIPQFPFDAQHAHSIRSG